MASTEEQTSCNREPFLSDEECNRGNVDIHQFDDFPYCDTINPTDPEIPPEIVDTPINIPIPPACACINVDSKYSAGWSRGWKTEGYFKSIGDCCDGNYESKFSLNIDCPIDFTGSRTISVNAKYGNGGGDSVPYISGDFCSITAENADLNIEIPCPVKSTKGSIGVGIGYGKGASYKKYDFLKGDTAKCTIEAFNPEFSLEIPCPVIGASEGRITIGIDYGDGAQTQTETFVKANAQACSIEALSPRIDLNIPCPIPSTSGSITVGVEYGNGGPARQTKDFIRGSKCELEILEPEMDLRIPCPVKSSKEFKIETSVSYGQGASRKRETFLVENGSTCAIDGRDPVLDMNIPCPVKRGDGSLTIGTKFAASSAPVTHKIIQASPGDCSITPIDQTFNLNIPCPIESGTASVGVSVGYGNGSGSGSVNVVSGSGGASCGLSFGGGNINLNIPCPTFSVVPGNITTSGKTGTVGIVPTANGDCGRIFTLNINFPDPDEGSGGGGGGGGGICVATGMTLDISSGNGITCKIHRTNSATGAACDDIKGTVNHGTFKSVDVVTDVKYENNQFQVQKRQIYVFDGMAGDPGEWEVVFDTTPLSDEL